MGVHLIGPGVIFKPSIGLVAFFRVLTAIALPGALSGSWQDGLVFMFYANRHGFG